MSGSAMIVGTGTTAFRRFPARSSRDLASEAVLAALADAGIVAGDVGLVAYGNAAAGVLTGQEMIRSQAALGGLLGGVPMVNVENACASSSSAFAMARLAVLSEQVDVALAVGVEKMVVADRSRVTRALLGATVLDDEDDIELDAAGAPFMEIYAQLATVYQQASGATQADFASVTVKNRSHGARNPIAAFQSEVTVDEVLASREIAHPLTLLMCSPITDGAAAVVLASASWCRRRGVDGVRVRACSLGSGGGDGDVVETTAASAYEQAAVAPGDIDVIELHDAASPAELITLEQLGIVEPGKAPALLASGDTAVGGRLPVNPSGGLVSRGHPIGATGCAQLVELADQLRGRCGPRQVTGARIALAENGGGWLGNGPAAAVVTILEGAT